MLCCIWQDIVICYWLVVENARVRKHGRIETINAMALSSLKANNRDMEKTIYLWKAGIEGAKMLQSETNFSEALTIFEFMKVVWPGERRIIELHDLTEHW